MVPDVDSGTILNGSKMYKDYLKGKWEWVDDNPRSAAWLGWAKGLITGFLIALFFFGCTAEQRYQKHVKDLDPVPQPKFNIELSALDSIKCIYYWEVQNDTLKIWTIEDELNNELERLEYIKENFYE